ncbi:N-acetyltransferase [Opitutaceae bacterium EW11]|nr:N-acetyltransferase [Opitutaceae bacterium EW11]
MNISLRPAVAADVSVVLGFIRDLAKYEQLSSECQATEAQVRDTLFGENPAAECLLAFADGEPAGFAVFFGNYSTFLARPGIYLEDIFVKPAFRKRGIGRALLLHVAKLANDRKCGRLEWTVLDWNEPAIEFYRGLGAQQLDEWRIFRLSGPALAKYA